MTGVTEQVERYYRTLLDQLNGGERLPSEREVVEELRTCRSTVRLVMTKLIAEKLVQPVHGRGYFKV